MYDLLITNGTIVDGTGQSSYSGNLAVNDGLIVAIGDVEGEAKQVIDAQGHIITPGWVDVHSHLDGQATWDPVCSPAVNHGITTLVMGNCGIGFAPCKPTEEARDQLISVVEDVEDIPGAALHEGIEWNWESFPEYLNVLEKFPRAIDVAAQVPHCAVRTYVMGERGVKNEKATPEDIASMQAIVKEGIEAGAIGFTTSRTELHTTRHAEVMPGTYADEDELLGIGSSIGEIGKGTYGVVSDWTNWEEEMQWMKQLSIENNCKVNFVLFFQHDKDWPRIQKQLAYVKEAKKEGAELIPHVGARPVNLMMSWEGTINPFSFHPSYAPASLLEGEARIEKLRDPEFRRAILADETPVMGDDFMDTIISGWDRLYELGTPPNYEPSADDSIAAKAQAAGVTPAEYAYDLMMKNEGKNVIFFPCFGYDSQNLDHQVEMLEDENSVISLSDTGAHCGVLSDVSVPTYLLSYLSRDRTRGKRFELEWAVKLHTLDTANSVGLLDRGSLEIGKRADINIIDFENLQIGAPHIVHDLPAGGRRMFQDASGYKATIVKGEVIMENGTHTGALPGQLIRGTKDAPEAA